MARVWIIGSLGLGLLLVFPPYEQTCAGQDSGLGHHFFLEPPSAHKDPIHDVTFDCWDARIDLGGLGTGCAALIAVTVGSAVWVARRKRTGNESPTGNPEGSPND